MSSIINSSNPIHSSGVQASPFVRNRSSHLFSAWKLPEGHALNRKKKRRKKREKNPNLVSIENKTKLLKGTEIKGLNSAIEMCNQA